MSAEWKLFHPCSRDHEEMAGNEAQESAQGEEVRTPLELNRVGRR